MNNKLGTKLNSRKRIIRGSLKPLGFKITGFDDKKIDLISPTFKVDVSREIDVIEEIARIHGYDTVRNR